MEIPDGEYLTLILAFRNLLIDYEHIGTVKVDVYARAVEEIVLAEKRLVGSELK